MSIIKQAFVGILLMLISTTYLFAQKTVKTNFSRTKMKHYKGRVDDINDVTLSLNCENGNCVGEFTYVRSREQFTVLGKRKNNELQLQEFNKEDNCTGYLNGKVEGKIITLDWENKAGTIGNSIQLKEVARKPDFPTFCGDNKWINAYSGNMNGEPIELILQRVENNRILGTAYYPSQKKKVVVEGDLSQSNNLHLTLIKEQTGEHIGSLRGVYKHKRSLNLSFYNQQQKQKFIALTFDKGLAINCLEYADHYTNYDFLFPKSDNAIFNEIMVLLTNDWISDCRKNAQTIRKKTPNAKVRASQRAYSWTDIALFTDDFISGMLTYHATWIEGEETKTFNYDFKNGEPIELEDIFKKGFDYQTFVKKMAREEIIKNPIYKNNKGFRNWIKDQEFSFFTLEKDGISFYTDFHIIYDRQRILIPYKKLKGNIRKNASVRQLF